MVAIGINNYTTIKIKNSIKKKLIELKLIPRETINDVIGRIIDTYKNGIPK